LPALAVLAAFTWSASGVAGEVAVEPAERPSGFYWNPSAVTIAPGGTVAFRNPGNVVPHGLHWSTGPETPSCSGVPVDGSGTGWSGTCTFAQAGTYGFVCTVHPEEMKGTITVGAGDGGAEQPAGQSPYPPAGSPFDALRLPQAQRGASVRGRVVIAPAGAGGKLTVELSARRAALGLNGSGRVRVGRLVRSHLEPGHQSFAVQLSAAAQRTLRQRGQLPVAVKVSIAPEGGQPVAVTRRVELHVG